MSGLPVLHRLPLKRKVSAVQVRRALTSWMVDNYSSIGFVREISERAADWENSDIQRSSCSNFCNTTGHKTELVGVIPGVRGDNDRNIDLVVYLHKAPGHGGWDLCFVWDTKQHPSGYRTEKDDLDPKIVLRAFATMPEELWLPTS